MTKDDIEKTIRAKLGNVSEVNAIYSLALSILYFAKIYEEKPIYIPKDKDESK